MSSSPTKTAEEKRVIGLERGARFAAERYRHMARVGVPTGADYIFLIALACLVSSIAWNSRDGFSIGFAVFMWLGIVISLRNRLWLKRMGP